MKLAIEEVDGLVDYLSLRVGGGTLAVYEGAAPPSPSVALPTFHEALVSVTLKTPAFEPASGGRAQILPLAPARIAVSGKAGWARLSTSSGKAVADFTVAEAGSAEALDADIVMKGDNGAEGTALAVGGSFSVQGWSLRLPVSL